MKIAGIVVEGWYCSVQRYKWMCAGDELADERMEKVEVLMAYFIPRSTSNDGRFKVGQKLQRHAIRSPDQRKAGSTA